MKELSHRTAFIIGMQALLTCTFFLPVAAWGWGSTLNSFKGDYETHQFIDAEAYACITKDPAYVPGVLPTYAQMKYWEDMSVDIIWTNSSLVPIGSGVGPDVDGNSQYSWHWYNPTINEGKGPEAVSMCVTSSASSFPKDPKATDWAAHFMADMSVPVHINGVMLGTALKIYNATPTNQPIYLDTKITGPLVQPLMGSFTNRIDWRSSFEAYLATTNSKCNDFFDPWYWLAKSHATWEMGIPVHKSDFRKDPKFSKWKNGAPSFDNYAINFAAKAEQLARDAAQKTYNEYTTYITAPGCPRAIDNSIQNVYTLWRASFSALQPEILLGPATKEGGNTTIKIGGRITNRANEDAKNVRVRLVTTIEGKDTILEEKDLKTIPGQRQEVTIIDPWEVVIPLTPEDSKIKPRFRMEVIGQYDTVPDLQYARHEKTLEPIEYSILIVMDCSGSMAGEKIEYAKKSANAQIDRLIRPTAENAKTEVAIIAFTDCGSIFTLTPFTTIRADNITAIHEQIDSLQASGGTPIAAACDYANSYLRFSQGMIYVVFLSDGEETCNGDPVKSAENLNN